MTNNAPQEPSADLRMAANAMRQMFISLVNEGFSEAQALQIIGHTVTTLDDRPGILGRTEPRVFTPPLRELTPETSAGFSVVQFAEEILGIELLPWQRWFLIHALELRPDGKFRFRKVLCLVARQNGKT
jgi:hypothetical protein